MPHLRLPTNGSAAYNWLHEASLVFLNTARAQGLVDDAAVIVQRQMIERLAIGAKASVVGLSEEEAGRAGFLAFHGPHGRFEESAQRTRPYTEDCLREPGRRCKGDDQSAAREVVTIGSRPEVAQACLASNH